MRVAGSNPVFRSYLKPNAEVVELVDTLDLKSNGHYGRAGSSPAFSTNWDKSIFFDLSHFLFPLKSLLILEIFKSSGLMSAVRTL